MSGYSISSCAEVVVGLVAGMDLGLVEGVGFGVVVMVVVVSASVRTLSAWAHSFNAL